MYKFILPQKEESQNYTESKVLKDAIYEQDPVSIRKKNLFKLNISLLNLQINHFILFLHFTQEFGLYLSFYIKIEA